MTLRICGAVLLLPTAVVISQAAAPEIPDACLSQARELAVTAGRNIIPEMTAEQRSELRRLATEICARHSAETPVADQQPRSSDSSVSDWFTERILKGEPADKPGNRRLQRRMR